MNGFGGSGLGGVHFDGPGVGVSAFLASVFACGVSGDRSSLLCSGVIGSLSSMSLPLPFSGRLPDGAPCSGLSSFVGVAYE